MCVLKIENYVTRISKLKLWESDIVFNNNIFVERVK